MRIVAMLIIILILGGNAFWRIKGAMQGQYPRTQLITRGEDAMTAALCLLMAGLAGFLFFS